jgi:hypothetical protein
MADIFSNAAKVLVWLGLETARTGLAIDLMQRVARRIEVEQGTEVVKATTSELH